MLRRLLSNNENCVEITSLLLKQLEVKVTNTTLQKELQNHPDYPSLLSIHDVISNYGVESISFKTDVEKFLQLPTPFIAQIKKDKFTPDLFTVIQDITDSFIRYYNPDIHGWQSVSIEEFEKIWISRIALLPYADNKRDEDNYKVKKREETQAQFTVWLKLLALPVITVGVSIASIINNGIAALYPALFLLITLTGTGIGALLLWYEFDKHNPILQQICSGGKKINCSAILQSKASKIAGISWSSIGFTYFCGALLLLLTTGIMNPQSLFVLTWINTLSLPYTFFSIYYQWRVAKQWCVLCLSIQAVLVAQVIVALAAGWHSTVAISSISSFNFLIPVLLCYLIPAIAVSLLLPAWLSAKEHRHSKAELQRLKHNPQIFEALLSKQKAIKEDSKELGITLGNPNASVKIIKVCNPYCGPCAKAHIPIEELLHNNPDIQVQIIFTATNAAEDRKAPPVKHLLAIAEKENQLTIKKALDDWYLADKKDYEAFASKYPMNGELKKQIGKIEAMSDWCDKTDISFTPTFFINGNQLPDIYSAHDLKYFLSQ